VFRWGELFGGGFLREINTIPGLQCSAKNTNIMELEKRKCKPCKDGVHQSKTAAKTIFYLQKGSLKTGIRLFGMKK
jgi:hypothetical protein